VSGPRLDYSRYRDYLHNDWRSSIGGVTILVDGKVLAKASHGIVATGAADTAGPTVELYGLDGNYHELVLPTGALGGRTIYLRESFPRLTAIDPRGHFVTAVLAPTGWGGDISHVPSLIGQVLEFTVSTQQGVLPSRVDNAKISLWLRNSQTLMAYQRTHHSMSRGGVETETSWKRDWLDLTLDGLTLRFEQKEKELTLIEISPEADAKTDDLQALRSAIIRALSLLFMQRLSPVMSGLTFAGGQTLTLHPPHRSPRGSRFVDADGSAEVEWLSRAIPFFAKDTELSRRTWSALEQVLDAHGQFRPVLTCVAIEHLARAYWYSTMGRGKAKFGMVKKLSEILETMEQPFLPDELEVWRWYRDGSLHGNDEFLDCEPKKRLESFEKLDTLLYRLLIGIVEYRGCWSP